MSRMPRTFAPHLRSVFLTCCLTALLVAWLASPPDAFGQARAQNITPEDVAKSPNELSSGDLVESPREHDGKTIEFTGEAIGEALERGRMSWVHLNDDAYYVRNIEEGAKLGGYNSGMPVWLSAESAREIAFFGDYRHEGDVVTIRGVFNAACPEHGGDMDIHAEELRVETPGHPVADPIHPRKVLAALVLLPLGLLLWWLDRQLVDGAPGRTRRSLLLRR